MRLTSTHVLTIEADLGPVVEVGRVATGVRRVIPIVGGVVRGGLVGVTGTPGPQGAPGSPGSPGTPRAPIGAVLAGGADWNLTRDDGSVELWARYEIRLATGALVSVTNTAVHAAGDAPVLTTPRFEVGPGGPELLRTGAFVGILEPPAGEPRVRVEVHRIAAGARA